MTSTPIRVIGLPWYQKADYQRLKTIFTDGGKLAPTFEQWEQAAEKLRQRCLAQGEIVVKAYIDPDTFPTWCAANGKGVDSSGRTWYANSIAADYARNMQKNAHS